MKRVKIVISIIVSIFIIAFWVAWVLNIFMPTSDEKLDAYYDVWAPQ